MRGNVQSDAIEKLNFWGERYRQHLEIINRSSGTVKNYIWHLSRFFDYLLEMYITDIHGVTTQVVQDYQKHLYYFENRKGKQDTVRSQNNHLKVVKDFFVFLNDGDHIAYNPAKDVRYAREPETLPKIILTGKEMKRIISQPDTGTLLGYRDRTILEVLYSTGIRRDELRSLKIIDVDHEEGYLRINSGKGDKDRVVPLGKVASCYLENYIKGIRPEMFNSKGTKELFLSKRGNKLSKNTVGELIEKYTRKANIKKHVTCHTFRHTCATHMVRNKANLRHVQEMLGHRSLNTTQKYIQLTITDLKEAHKKYHPREKEKDK